MTRLLPIALALVTSLIAVDAEAHETRGRGHQHHDAHHNVKHERAQANKQAKRRHDKQVRDRVDQRTKQRVKARQRRRPVVVHRAPPAPRGGSVATVRPAPRPTRASVGLTATTELMGVAVGLHKPNFDLAVKGGIDPMATDSSLALGMDVLPRATFTQPGSPVVVFGNLGVGATGSMTLTDNVLTGSVGPVAGVGLGLRDLPLEWTLEARPSLVVTGNSEVGSTVAIDPLQFGTTLRFTF